MFLGRFGEVMRGHLDVIVVGYLSRGHEMDWIVCVVSSWCSENCLLRWFVRAVCRGWWGLLLVGISCLSVEFLSARWG